MFLIEGQRQLKGECQLLKGQLPRSEVTATLTYWELGPCSSIIESNRRNANALNRSLVQHNTLMPFRHRDAMQALEPPLDSASPNINTTK